MDQDLLHFKLGDDFVNVGCVKYKCLLLVMLHLYNFFLYILFNVLTYERHFKLLNFNFLLILLKCIKIYSN